MHCLRAIWSWLSEWWPYGVYELSNFLLIGFGIWLSFEGVAKTVETNKVYRRALAVLCFLLGGTGMYFDAIARHDSDKSGRQLIEKVGTTLDKTNELSTKTNALLTKTNSLVTNTDFQNFEAKALPQLAILRERIIALDKEIAAAKEQHDPQRTADLEAKAKETQQQADRISRELQALKRAPALIDQLRNWRLMSEWAQLEIIGRQDSEYQRYSHDHPNDSQGYAEIVKKYTPEINKATQQSEDYLRAYLADAASIQKELLQWVPNQNALDKTRERQFAQLLAQPLAHPLGVIDPMEAAAYIEELVKRVPPPK